MKPVTLKFVGYKVTGIADVSLWGGGGGFIEMESFVVKRIEDITLDSLNDSGFGVECINGAHISLYKLYEKGHIEFYRNMKIGNIPNINEFFESQDELTAVKKHRVYIR